MEMTYGNTTEALDVARRVLARNPSYDPCCALRSRCPRVDVTTKQRLL